MCHETAHVSDERRGRRRWTVDPLRQRAIRPGAPNSSTRPASATPLSAKDLDQAVARLRSRFAKEFDPAYVENVILPHFLVATYEGERLSLPMIDVKFTKENALPYDLWGMLSETWKPAPEAGVTVFLQGLEKRGPDNRRKRIYMSAVTPDLYKPMYSEKVAQFFDKLLDSKNAGRPLMRPYLDDYFDMYWDLHLGVKGDAIPARVRQIGDNFNTVLAYRDPTQKIVYENYMSVRSNLGFLKKWIDERLADIAKGKTPNPEKTFAHYWIKNAGDGEHFAHKDVVFECFHNFVAFSQWGNTIYNIMLKLSRNAGDPDARAWFKKTMSGNFDRAGGGAFTPLDRFVMELFRTITPNGGSISAVEEVRTPRVRTARLCRQPASREQRRSDSLEGPEPVQPGSLQHGSDQPPDRRGQVRADRLRPLPVRAHRLRGQGRPQGRAAQQRLRHRLRHRRQQAAAGLRLRRLRAVRLRLPALPRRAAHDPGVRGLPAQGVDEQDRVRAAQDRQAGTASYRPDHGHQRRCRVHARRHKKAPGNLAEGGPHR